MFSKLSSVLLAVVSFCFVGCAAENKDLNDSYHLVENGCDTGKHDFSSSNADDLRNKVCSALQSSSVNNNGCALFMRKAEFGRRCPGRVFTQTY